MMMSTHVVQLLRAQVSITCRLAPDVTWHAEVTTGRNRCFFIANLSIPLVVYAGGRQIVAFGQGRVIGP